MAGRIGRNCRLHTPARRLLVSLVALIFYGTIVAVELAVLAYLIVKPSKRARW